MKIVFRLSLYMGAFLLIFTSCFARASVMSRSSYDSVTVGTSIAQLEEEIGKPDSVRSRSGGIQEYEYIERIRVNNDYSVENTYYLEVLNGVVVAKRMTTKQSPAYEFMYPTEPNFSPNYSPNFGP